MNMSGGGHGRALFRVSPLFYRGKINPDSVQQYSEGLEKHLSDEKNVDVTSEAVKTTVQEISRQLPQWHRNNPYAMADGIVHWIKDNIEYTLVAPHIVDDIGRTTSTYPKNKDMTHSQF